MNWKGPASEGWGDRERRGRRGRGWTLEGRCLKALLILGLLIRFYPECIVSSESTKQRKEMLGIAFHLEIF